MSGAQTAAAPGATSAPPPDDGISNEAIARRMGWRPKEEYKGPSEKWVDADAFLDLAAQRPAVFLSNQRKVEQQFTALEGRLAAQTTQLTEAQRTAAEMREMMSRTEERAYKRAKADLERERDAAIERGDVAAVRAKDAEIADLGTPPAKPAPATTTAPTQQPTPGAQPEVHPEVREWLRGNPWFIADPELNAVAQTLHVSMMKTEPGLTLGENLNKVTERMRRMYPEKFPAAPPTNGAGEPEPEPPDDNPRRREPAPVAGAGEPPARGGRRNARTFESMPKDAKDQYERWKRMLEGKGKPYTKEEHAQYYWDQIEEV
jgi:hypothetical protein